MCRSFIRAAVNDCPVYYYFTGQFVSFRNGSWGVVGGQRLIGWSLSVSLSFSVLFCLNLTRQNSLVGWLDIRLSIPFISTSGVNTSAGVGFGGGGFSFWRVNSNGVKVWRSSSPHRRSPKVSAGVSTFPLKIKFPFALTSLADGMSCLMSLRNLLEGVINESNSAICLTEMVSATLNSFQHSRPVSSGRVSSEFTIGMSVVCSSSVASLRLGVEPIKKISAEKALSAVIKISSELECRSVCTSVSLRCAEIAAKSSFSASSSSLSSAWSNNPEIPSKESKNSLKFHWFHSESHHQLPILFLKLHHM